MMMCEKNLVQSEISNSQLYSLSVEDLAMKAGKYVDSKNCEAMKVVRIYVKRKKQACFKQANGMIS